MCSRTECMRHVGQYVRFTTPYGYHEGVIERVTNRQAIVLSPRRFIPAQLAADSRDADQAERLDLALCWGGYGRYPAYGGGYGRAGYGYGGWGYGWGRWAVSWLVIFALFGLWW